MIDLIKLECYVADGDSMKLDHVEYGVDPESAYVKYVKLVSEKDESGERKYVSVRPYLAAYKLIEDPNAFFNQFKIT